MRRTHAVLVLAAIGAAIALQAPSGAPLASPQSGQADFTEKCAMCHRQMGMGTVLLARRMKPDVAELEKRADLEPEFVVAAVRGGIGNMPRITRGEVSDAQLARIAAYLARKDQTRRGTP